ncbi:MAG: hypothetical protein A2527_01285 [Candidatus Lambdaproteobacteria bacterium RIFOXYD2_FULL_50_16]|uniref:Outer membrane protein beta-barrel domain-containing protein n=1 Tax=Candidatus Lambdaproteobacteria bacterium RIFOXYD2_FULL_50_16 TaxID=1817772 RepID=A0A1F6GEL8_9PROT|nr:MAG: hypothetical protein A2527_01285 [Candidatus Lambdaproteobacteria bacterium RIFOXYD2_FULL_50_16]
MLAKILLTTLAFTSFAWPALAGDRSGWGVYGGASGMQATDENSGEVYLPAGGGGGGIDYNQDKGEISFNYSLSETGNQAESTTSPELTWVKFNALAMEIRFWAGSFFIGPRFGLYNLVLSETGSKISGMDQGFGYGWSTGWETDQGWFAQFRREQARHLNPVGDLRLNLDGYSLLFGFRFH